MTDREWVESLARGLAVITAFNAERPAMTLAEVAAIVGMARLSASAYRSPRWWHNNPEHPQARDGWLAAGWRVADADLAGEVVTFVRGGAAHPRRR